MQVSGCLRYSRCQQKPEAVRWALMSRETLLLTYYQTMLEHLGNSHWWPGDSPFEIAVGAVLTQNTNWNNVEKAIVQLKARDMLSPSAMMKATDADLAACIRPAGFYNVKVKRLRALLEWMAATCGSDLERLQAAPLEELRPSLLAVKGVGPETADAILLYALKLPTFVVDTYTRRIFCRHGLVPEDIGYEELREFFMDVLPEDITLYNEYHALIVRVGKEWCRPKPRCQTCPLQDFRFGEGA